MSEDPSRLHDDPETPQALREDLGAARGQAPPALDYAAGLAALSAAIRGPDGAPPDAPAGPPAGSADGATSAASSAGIGTTGVFVAIVAALLAAGIGLALVVGSASQQADAPAVESGADTAGDIDVLAQGHIGVEGSHEPAALTLPQLTPISSDVVPSDVVPSDVVPSDPPPSEQVLSPESATPPSTGAPHRSGAPATDGDSLRREMMLVEQMRRALDVDPARALELATQADRSIGRGTFGDERESIRVLALFATGREARARQLATRLLTRDPRGLYAERIRRAMEQTTR